MCTVTSTSQGQLNNFLLSHVISTPTPLHNYRWSQSNIPQGVQTKRPVTRPTQTKHTARRTPRRHNHYHPGHKARSLHAHPTNATAVIPTDLQTLYIPNPKTRPLRHIHSAEKPSQSKSHLIVHTTTPGVTSHPAPLLLLVPSSSIAIGSSFGFNRHYHAKERM